MAAESVQHFTGQARCAEWNRWCPIGTPVVVRRIDQTTFTTRTASAAWMLGADTASTGTAPVVLLEGVLGAYPLDRCTPLSPRIDRLAAIGQRGAGA